MTGLTRKEELILLSILNLQKDAYLVAITDHLSQIMRNKVTITSVHLPLLEEDEESGFIRSRKWVLKSFVNTKESTICSGQNIQ